jgi:hypothetical protein
MQQRKSFLLEWALRLYHLRTHVIRLDAGDFGLGLIAWIHMVVDAVAVVPWNRHPPEESLLPTSYLDQRGIGQTQQHRALLWTRFPLLSPPTSASPWLVSYRPAGRFDLHRHHHCRGFLPGLPGVPI